MRVHEIIGFEVTGFITRTTNADEVDSSTAKIEKLWQQFYSNAAPMLNLESKIYGIYTNYESDFSGAFDIIAGSDTFSSETLADAVKVKIAGGRYITFCATGEMPSTVINLWLDVWNYFAHEDCVYKRAYTTDFEYYKSANEVEISIAIKG